MNRSLHKVKVQSLFTGEVGTIENIYGQSVSIGFKEGLVNFRMKDLWKHYKIFEPKPITESNDPHTDLNCFSWENN